MAKIISKKHLGKLPVFDVQSKPNGNFIANGLIVHNTNFFEDVNVNKSKNRKYYDTSFSKADLLYSSMLKRMKYSVSQAKMPGMLLLVSSKQTQEDFTDRVIKEEKDNPNIKVYDFPLWEVKPGFEHDATFKVLVGIDNIKNKVLNLEKPEDRLLVQQADGGELNGYIIDVPVSFKRDFEKNIDEALRDIAGISTSAIVPFMPDVERISQIFEDSREHPSIDLVWQADKPFAIEWNKLSRRLENGDYVPIVNPEAPRAAHIDPSLTRDCTGISICHVAGTKEVIRRDLEGKEYRENAPIIYVDFILRIAPPENGEIQLGDVRTLLYQFSTHGFNIKHISMDTFNSADSLQQFRLKGYDANIISVDRTLEPYDIFKAAIYEHRIMCYPYEPLFEELKELEFLIKRRKVDHRPGRCFVGETRIPLLDGTCPTIAELAEKEVWVYSCTPDGKMVPGKAKGRLSGYVIDLVDIVLDSGAIARCTPEHRWLLRNGTYKQAKDLRPGVDRLMPIKRYYPVSGGYESLSGKLGRKGGPDYELTHRMVIKNINGNIPENCIVHHKNEIKTDNRPENLEVLNKSNHSYKHTLKRHMLDKEYTKALLQGAARFNNSLEGKKKHSIAMKKTVSSFTENDFYQMAKKRPQFRRDITIEKLIELANDPNIGTAYTAARVLNCGRNVIIRVLKRNNYNSWEDFVNDKAGANHRVRYVIPIKLDTPVPVYDLEVDTWHNFALSIGIFVHNSKDTADSLAAVVYKLTKLFAEGYGVDFNSAEIAFKGISESSGNQAIATSVPIGEGEILWPTLGNEETSPEEEYPFATLANEADDNKQTKVTAKVKFKAPDGSTIPANSKGILAEVTKKNGEVDVAVIFMDRGLGRAVGKKLTDVVYIPKFYTKNDPETLDNFYL